MRRRWETPHPMQICLGSWSNLAFEKGPNRKARFPQVCFSCGDGWQMSKDHRGRKETMPGSSMVLSWRPVWQPVCCLFPSSGTPSGVVLSRPVGKETKVQTGCRMIILGEIKSFQFYFLWAKSVLGLSQMVQEQTLSVISFLVTVNYTYVA